MRESEIVARLNIADTDFVRYAVGRANLTDEEQRVIYTRINGCLTVSKTAEALLMSDHTVKRRYRTGIGKLNACWSALPWMGGVLKQ